MVLLTLYGNGLGFKSPLLIVFPCKNNDSKLPQKKKKTKSMSETSCHILIWKDLKVPKKKNTKKTKSMSEICCHILICT